MKAEILLCVAVLSCAAIAQNSHPKPDENTAIAGPAGKIPEAFPKDVPLPLYSKPMNSLVRPDGSRRLVLESPGKAEDVITYYAKELPSKGWSVTTQKSRAAGGSIVADKGSRNLAIGVFDRKGTVMVSIEVDAENKR